MKPSGDSAGPWAFPRGANSVAWSLRSAAGLGETGGVMARLTSAYDAGAAGAPLVGDTIGASLAKTVARQPDVEALVSVHQGIRLTYGEFAVEVGRVARGLMALGVDKGDRVGIWSPTCVEWTLLQFACARVGAILVNVNPAYRSHELAYALGQSGVRVLVTARAFKTSDYLAMVTEVRPGLAELERVVTIDGEAAGGGDDIVWSELIGAEALVDPERLAAREADLDPDDPINIQYTSGTTGNPKGATLSHHNILNNALSVAGIVRYTSADRVCVPVPLYHCFGMGIGNLGCVSTGATIVYPAASFEPEATLRAIADERCTSIYGVPTMFIAELDHPRFPGFDLSTLRTGIMAGSPCPTEVMKRVVNSMNLGQITIAYGMTETSPVSFQTAADDPLEKRVGSVGRIHPHVEVKIVDVEDRIVPPGTPMTWTSCTLG